MAGLLFALGMTGCISDIAIEQDEGQVRFVIEGEIDSGNFARVLVSRSQPFFSTFGTSDLISLVVDNAQVFLSDGGTTEQLQFVVDTFYTKVPVYRSFRMKGETGKIYTLTVNIGENVYVATDTLRPGIRPDSIVAVPSGENSNQYFLHYRISDPPEYGNCYSISLKRIGRDDDYLNAPMVLFNDELFNGEVWEAPLFLPSSNFLTDRNIYFNKDETVVVKTRVISRKAYDIMEIAGYQSLMVFNPFQNGQPVPTNFSGDVLGIWGTYGVHLDTINIR
ncbi:MAG: DUF4249 family protein [Bacteroidales bacterium]|nr:DUF4249 family protein [Bacteroidales bacterium]